MQLRKATKHDLGAVRVLVAEVGREFGFEPEPEGADLDLYASVDVYFTSSSLLEVLERNSAVVGVLGVVQRSATEWELRKLYLAAEERSRGHGRRLAQRAIEFAREQGAHQLVLQSSLKLSAALSLYKSLGFTEVADKPHSATCDVSLKLNLTSIP